MQGNPDFPPEHSAEHKLLPTHCGHSLGVSRPALHMHTVHIHTDKHTVLLFRGPQLCLSVGEARCRWHRDSSVFLGSLVGGKLLVKYTGMFYFIQPTMCSTFPNCPFSPPSSASLCSLCTLCSAYITEQKALKVRPSVAIYLSVPPSGHTATEHRALCGEAAME